MIRLFTGRGGLFTLGFVVSARRANIAGKLCNVVKRTVALALVLAILAANYQIQCFHLFVPSFL